MFGTRYARTGKLHVRFQLRVPYRIKKETENLAWKYIKT